MCGLIGIYGDDLNVWQREKKGFLIDGIVVDQLRGEDGTGLACIPRNKNAQVQVFKRAIKGADFVEQKKVGKLINNLEQYIGVMVHNRSWTRGAAIDENCHPFKFGHITLIHNGTVNNATSLVTGADYKQLDVDSAHVAYAFSLEDEEDVLPKLQGGYSLVWWNDDTRTLHFARNDVRPMYFAFGPNKEQALYWGSEAEMVVLCANRNGAKLHLEMFATTPYVHYIFKDARDVRSIEKRPFTQHRVVVPPVDYRSGPRVGNRWTPTPPASAGPDGKETPSVEGPFQSLRNTALTDDGEKHPATEDPVTPQGAAVISEAPENGSNRRRQFIELAMQRNINTQGFVGMPFMWTPYNLGDKQAANVGVMMIRQERASAGDKLWVQVYNVHKTRWEILKNHPVVVDVINFRRNEKWGTGNEVLFVGKINEDLQQKYLTAAAAGASKIGSGFREDWIEIGTSRKRSVSPAALEAILANGCTACSDPIQKSDLDDLTWVGAGDDRPVCVSCSNNESILDSLAHIN